MKILLLIALLGTAIYYWFPRFRSWLNRFPAAQNVVLAKYTFNTLSEVDRRRVEVHANQLVSGLLRGPFTGFSGEVDRYGWYALAMAELGIQPGIPQAIAEGKWNYVRNPFFAVLPGDRDLDAVCESLKRKFGVEISISKEHRLFDGIKNAGCRR